MSEEAGTSTVSEEATDSADRLLAIGQNFRRGRGRPAGSKNKPKDESAPPRVNQNLQKGIFASALIALFAVLAVVLGWFGYEQVEALSRDEAEEGGECLIPIAAKIGWIAAAAFYLTFPAWLIAKLPQKFRKKSEPKAAAGSPHVNGSAPPGPSVSNSAVGESPGSEGRFDSTMHPMQ